MPTVARPAWDVYTNKQYFSGAPILSQRDMAVSPQQQDAPFISPTIRAAAQNMPDMAPDLLKSPKELQVLASGYFGTLGQWATGLADMATTQITGETRPAARGGFAGFVGAVPGGTQIYKEGPSGRTIQTESMYKVDKQISEAYNSFNRYIQGGDIDRARQTLEGNRELLEKREAYTEAVKQVSELQKVQRQIQQDKDMSPEDKQKYLDKAQESINTIADQIYKFRPGGRVTPEIAGKLIGATRAQASQVLDRAGLPATAALVRSFPTQEAA